VKEKDRSASNSTGVLRFDNGCGTNTNPIGLLERRDVQKQMDIEANGNAFP